ncbi:MAG: glycosyltransferase, partial [Candidatus Omnitrophica bacterium]|nr:glycosyltransferase [Candidatus Omnitrophota bacterium]
MQKNLVPRILQINFSDEEKLFGGLEKIMLEIARGIRDRGYPTAVAINECYTLAEARKTGLAVFPLRIPSKRNIPAAFSELSRVFREFQPDIVHSHHRYM